MDRQEENLALDKPIVIFDSACMLCTWSINFILENEVGKPFFFTALSSDFAKSLNLEEKYIDPIPDSIILFYQNKVYLESSAILTVAQWLQAPYKYLKFLKIVPAFLRNFFYKLIARNRYKWFGTHEDNCYWVPPKERHRFLK